MPSNTENSMMIVCLYGMIAALVSGCKEPLDLVFLVDGSKGVKPSDFIQEKAFISSQTMEYFVSSDRVNIAVILYSDKVYDVIDFKESENEDQFVNRVSGMKQPFGGIVISAGLKSAHERFVSKGRPNVKRSVVVITTGRTSRLWDSFREGRRLRHQRASIYAIGVGGNVSKNELMGLTSDRNNVLLVDTFNMLFTLSLQLHELICPGYQQIYPQVSPQDSSSILKPQITVINDLNNRGSSPLLPPRYSLIDVQTSNKKRNPMSIKHNVSVKKDSMSENITIVNLETLSTTSLKTTKMENSNMQEKGNKNKTVFTDNVLDLDTKRSQDIDTDDDTDRKKEFQENNSKIPIIHKFAWGDIISGLNKEPNLVTLLDVQGLNIANIPNSNRQNSENKVEEKKSLQSLPTVIQQDTNVQITRKDKKEQKPEISRLGNMDKSKYSVNSELPHRVEKVSTVWDTILANMDLHSVVQGQLEIPKTENVQHTNDNDQNSLPNPLPKTTLGSFSLDDIVKGLKGQQDPKRGEFMFDKTSNVKKNDDIDIHLQFIPYKSSKPTQGRRLVNSSVNTSTVRTSRNSLPTFVVTSTPRTVVTSSSSTTPSSKVFHKFSSYTTTKTATGRPLTTTVPITNITASNHLSSSYVSFKPTRLTTQTITTSVKRLPLNTAKNKMANYLNSINKKEFRLRQLSNIHQKYSNESRKGRPIDINMNTMSNSNKVGYFEHPLDLRQEITSILDYLLLQQDRRKRKRKHKKVKTITTVTPEIATTTPLVLWKDVAVDDRQEDRDQAQDKRYIDMTRFGKRNIPYDWNFRRSAKFLPNNEISSQPKITETNAQENEHCHLVPYEKDGGFYLDHSDNRTVIRPCPEGTAFDLRSCACTIMTTFSGLSDCDPEILLDFETGIRDRSGKNIHVGSHFVDLSNGSAIFHGDSDLTIWRFTGSHIGQQFMIKARFKTKKSPEIRQYLISNCQKDLPLISYGIEIDRYEEVVIFSLDTEPREPQLIKLPFKLDQWTTVVLMYDGLKLTGMVDDKVKSVPLAGDVETRSSPLRIGGCGGKKHGFTGIIDEISLSMCIPQRNRRHHFG